MLVHRRLLAGLASATLVVSLVGVAPPAGASESDIAVELPPVCQAPIVGSAAVDEPEPEPTPVEPEPEPSVEPTPDATEPDPEPTEPVETWECPDAVTNVAGAGDDASVTLTWAPPANVDSVQLTAYYVQVQSDGRVIKVDPSVREVVVDGLVNGEPETFVVYAASERGRSAASAPVTLTPSTGSTGEIAGLIVKFAPSTGVSPGDHVLPGKEWSDSVDLTVDSVIADSVHLVEISEAVSPEQAGQLAAELQADPRVEWAEPDILMLPASLVMPDDPEYATSQWNLWGEYGLGIGRGRDGAAGELDISAGSGTVVAVIDTGITSHPDLDSQVVPGYDFVSDPASLAAPRVPDGPDVAFDDDGQPGRDADPTDPGDWRGVAPVRNSTWHGTQVAGVIAAQANNGEGIVGVAPGAKILPVRALSWRGGLMSDIISSITWASGGSVDGAPANANPADVITMSFAAKAMCSVALQAAIDGATARGSVLVAAAGNAGADVAQFAPANCRDVIAVGATGRDGKRAPYSNFGPGVDISAPGGSGASGVMSTSNAGLQGSGGATYVSAQGTSIAAAHVAGVIARVRSAEPGLSTGALRARFLNGEQVRAFPDNQCDVDPNINCGTGLLTLVQVSSGTPASTGVTASDPDPTRPWLSVNCTNISGTHEYEVRSTGTNTLDTTWMNSCGFQSAIPAGGVTLRGVNNWDVAAGTAATFKSAADSQHEVRISFVPGASGSFLLPVEQVSEVEANKPLRFEFTWSSAPSVPDFTVTPALPAGLTTSVTSGDVWGVPFTTFVINGTPTNAQDQTRYTISATSGSETINATLDLEITGPVPSLLPPGLTVIQGAPNHVIEVDCNAADGFRRYFVPWTITDNATFDSLQVRGIASCASKAHSRYNSQIGPSSNCSALTAFNPNLCGAGLYNPNSGLLDQAFLYRNTRYQLFNTGPGNVAIGFDIIFYFALDKRYPAGVWTPTSQTVAGARGTTITPTLAYSIDGPTAPTFSISPPLPNGLNLDTVTGVISGTPTVAHPTTTHTVTATMGASAPTATVTITIALNRVTFNAGGGTVSPTFADTTSASQSVTLPTPTRANHVFNGWFTQASGGTLVGMGGAPYVPATSVTLFAQWTPPYVVTYNRQGGSGTPASASVTPGGSLTLPTQNNQAALNFAGWYDSPSGGVRLGGSGTSLTPIGSMTVYAQWNATFSLMLGSGSLPASYGSSTRVININTDDTTIVLPEPTRAGHRFGGWWTASSGGTKVGDAGDSLVINSNRTIHARWLAQRTVDLMPRGGSITDPQCQDLSGTCRILWTTGDPAVVLPTPTSASGLNFDGWFTADSGGIRFGGGGHTFSPTSNVTYRAQWTGSRTYDANGGAAIAPVTAKTDTWATVPVPYRPGFAFVHWMASNPPVGPTPIARNATNISMTKTETWTALWQQFSDAPTLTGARLSNDRKTIRVHFSDSVQRLYTDAMLCADFVVKSSDSSFNTGSRSCTVDGSDVTITRTTGTGLAVDVTELTVAYVGRSLASAGDSSLLIHQTADLPVGNVSASFTVTFGAGFTGGQAPAPMTGDWNSFISLPAPPVRPGFVFLGWFRDSGRNQRAGTEGSSFRVTGNTTLVARWIAPERPPVPVDRGDGVALVDDTVVPITKVTGDDTVGVSGTVGGQRFEMNLRGVDADSAPVELSPDGYLVLAEDRRVEANGSGFVPESPVSFYLLSPANIGVALRNALVVRQAVNQPISLGTLTVDDSGVFEGTLDLPPGLAGGDYLIQAVGVAGSGEDLSITLGVRVEQAPTVESDPAIPAGAPLNVRATASDASARVTWSPPERSGSFPITHYQLVGSPSGGCLVQVPARSCVITGLTNGTAYTFTVRALNGAGWGPYSLPSNTVTPGKGSEAPAPDAQAPTTPIAPGESIATEDGQPVPVVSVPNSQGTGVSINGDGFDLTLEGVDGRGTPIGLGSDGVLVLSRDRQIAARGSGFGPGAPVAFYLFSPASTAGSSSGPTLLGTLPVGVDGTFTGTVTLPATIGEGDHVIQAVGSATSGATRAVNLGVRVERNPAPSKPGPVRDLQVVRATAKGVLVLKWRAPADDGGAPVESYRVRQRRVSENAYVRIVPNVTSTRITITGLTPGQRYWVRVAARNAAGNGPGTRIEQRVRIPTN